MSPALLENPGVISLGSATRQPDRFTLNSDIARDIRRVYTENYMIQHSTQTDPINVTCLKDGTPNSESQVRLTMENGVTSVMYSIIIDSIEDSGVYQCIITDAATSGSELLLPHPIRAQASNGLQSIYVLTNL